MKVNLNSLRVLYAEDDTDTREALSVILNKFFLEVVVAKNGQQGIDLFQEYNDKDIEINMILSDINMPHKNGLEMIAEIREVNNNIPVILMTAHAEANFLMDAINLNVAQYLVKPVNIPLLFEKIKLAYLPIHQKVLLKQKNIELEQLNQKIKEIAKKEMDELRLGYNYVSDNDEIDFGELLDSITLDE